VRIVDVQITRSQVRSDWAVDDSQVHTDAVSLAALDLIADSGPTKPGFIQSLFSSGLIPSEPREALRGPLHRNREIGCAQRERGPLVAANHVRESRL